MKPTGDHPTLCGVIGEVLVEYSANQEVRIALIFMLNAVQGAIWKASGVQSMAQVEDEIIGGWLQDEQEFIKNIGRNIRGRLAERRRNAQRSSASSVAGWG